MDVDRAKQHYNTDIKQYRMMVIRALNSLRSDLGQGPKTEPIEDVKLDANMASVEPESHTPDYAQTTANDRGKAKLEPKQDPSKKSKSKASAAKETLLSGFSDSEQDEVETIPVFKKS